MTVELVKIFVKSFEDFIQPTIIQIWSVKFKYSFRCLSKQTVVLFQDIFENRRKTRLQY